ncbi:TetR/AcrR family transcriptional regulator [Rapidithrix thailandica]|uniref:TetR/AcrR family transcriptional regulator n=1 Tax=Rapidithrix thailandica TaxID=413964 RepID=A0AAW9SDQ1_9BACT
MRPQKVDDQKLLSGLMSVLRSKGYDGASLNELASASGLQKASLYHRYPGGKKDITLAVLQFVNQWLEKHIVNILTHQEREPEERLREALKNINLLYDSGKLTCILRALSMDSGLDLFKLQLQEAMQAWIHAFGILGKNMGMSEELSKKKAVQTLVKVQGSLVVCKTLEDYSFFDEALKDIEKMYRDT